MSSSSSAAQFIGTDVGIHSLHGNKQFHAPLTPFISPTVDYVEAHRLRSAGRQFPPELLVGFATPPRSLRSDATDVVLVPNTP